MNSEVEQISAAEVDYAWHLVNPGLKSRWPFAFWPYVAGFLSTGVLFSGFGSVPPSLQRSTQLNHIVITLILCHICIALNLGIILQSCIRFHVWKLGFWWRQNDVTTFTWGWENWHCQLIMLTVHNHCCAFLDLHKICKRLPCQMQLG